ncbi:MAG: ribonuclease R [Pirellulaceae bacterium]
MPTQDLPQRVLDHVNRDEYKPVKPRTIAKQLKLPEDDLRELKTVIKRLVKKGQLRYGPRHLVLKANEKPAKKKGAARRKTKHNEVVGRFSRAAGGFGFVAVAPDPKAGPDDLPPEDVYIPQRRTLDAASGDIVRVKLTARREGKRLKTSGRVIEIVERRTHQFVGTYHERGQYGLVSIDGNQFDTDVLVGDAGAKACRIGDKVVVEMVRFPGMGRGGDYTPGEAVIVKVLGDRGTPGVDTLTIIAEFGLPGDFSEQVLDDARDQAEEFDESIDGRTDFTGETIVTIDPKTARDFDDAISLKRIENGHWQLGVHIADVSHFVQPNTELDNEAYRRATSIYLPDRVIPMLPEIISNNLASLQPDRVRYCMTALIEFTDDGVPVGTELHRGAIKSCHRFNYEEIDDYLQNDTPWKKKLKPEIFELVRNMHTLAMNLRQRRMARGSFDLVIPEVEIDLDKNGKVSGAHTREHTESHQVIEEFMLAANEAVARHMVDLELYLMRRIHEPPSPIKMSDLTTLLGDLGYKAKNLQSRFELKKIIEASRDQPESHAVHFAILRAMQKAIYSPREVGHYALASEAYCHFTSPIRRYPDLVIHRMIGALIDGQKPASEFGLLNRLGIHCSEMEQRAESAERQLIKLKMINFLTDKIGMEMDAVITGVEAYGLFAQGVELPANGFVPLDSLPHDQYFFDRGTRRLSGHRSGNQFRLGDPVRIRVVSADPDRREVEFALVTGAAKGKKKGGKNLKRDSRAPKMSSGKSTKHVDGKRPRKHR